MYEKELEKAQERLNAAVSLANKQPKEAVNMIMDMQKWVDENIPNDTSEYLGVVITYNEAMGDIALRIREFVQAESFYKNMVNAAIKLYEMDKEKYDLRLAVAYCKLANNCATNINCHTLQQKPRLLNEKTQKPFDAGENFYKVAIKIIQDNCKKGSGKHLEIRARAINSLAVMEAAVGHYKESILMFNDAVQIQKAIYQTLDDKASAIALGGTLQTQSTVCTLYKDAAKAQECLEDSIYVLKEHEDEEAVRIGVLIARNYMNLAGCKMFLKESQEEVDATYEKALQKISMVNAIAKDAALHDEASCYMITAQYYKATGRDEKAVKLLNHANDVVDRLLQRNPENVQFKNMKNNIEAMLEKNKTE